MSVTSELNVGLDAALTKSCVDKCGDYHASNGSKIRTINGLDVNIHATHVKIDSEKGLYGTIVPTAECDRKGPSCSNKPDKSGTCGLNIRESPPDDAEAL